MVRWRIQPVEHLCASPRMAGVTWYCGIRARWFVWLLSNVKTSKTPTQFTRNLQRQELIGCVGSHISVSKKKEAWAPNTVLLLKCLRVAVDFYNERAGKWYLRSSVNRWMWWRVPDAAQRSAGAYLVLPVIRILLGSMTRQARPAVWMVRSAELSWTM